MRKNYFVLIFSLLAATYSFGQDYMNISDGGTHVIDCFADSVIVIDSGGLSGPYGPNETHEITFCLAPGLEGNLEVVLSPALFGDTWDVDAGSFFSVHNGASSASPQIGGGMFNSINDPFGFLVRTTQGCITLVFTTGPTSSGQGFTAHVRCENAFQPFFVTLEADPEFVETTVDSLCIAICYTDTFTVTATTSYPLSDASGNGYTQSDATSYFNWQMGDGTSQMGFGLTQITHAYSSGAGHEVNLSIIDASGTIQYYRFYVLHSPRPDFSNIALDDTLCIGTQTVITGGINYLQQDTVGVGPGTGSILGGGAVGGQETIFDANPPLCDVYSIPLIINEFEEGQVLEDINDLFNICVNMHHTYLGDLEMGLVCPGGQDTLVLFDMRSTSGQCPNLFVGGTQAGGRDLGEPFASPIAIGYDYCFNNDPEFGTFGVVNAALPGAQSMPAGSYETMSPMSDLLGCPLNGEWQLILLDGWQANVGVVNGWSIFFNPDINPSTKYYTPIIVSAGWDENSDLIVNDDSTSVTVAPSHDGNNSFVFWAYDEFGCRHDTVINIYVRPEINLDDDIACDLTQILAPYDNLDEAVKDGVYTIVSTPTSTADIIFEQLGSATWQATATEYGIYEIRVTSEDCGYTDTAFIDYRPDPVIEPFISDTVLCIGASIVLDAGPQEANHENFNINWISSNTGTFNTDDYAVTINETGTYYLIITGHCGVAMDTTDVVAITLDYEGKTTCGLQSAVTAVIAPAGPGKWSGPENISFTNANQLGTQISSSQYGTYDITYTDDRCLQDGLTRQFTFVEQPEAVILPQNPDFCVDLDPLIVSATVSGSFNGTYMWRINGESQTTMNDSLFFGSMFFEPLEDYLFEVTVQDAYSICPLATGEMTFTGKWCEFNIPNVVTPNGDGKNDTFYVEHVEYFPSAHLRVFDRWGLKVFDQANYDKYQNPISRKGWDPKDLNSGTYYYELLLPSVEKMESGYIQILKEEP